MAIDTYEHQRAHIRINEIGKYERILGMEVTVDKNISNYTIILAEFRRPRVVSVNVVEFVSPMKVNPL